MTFSPHFGLGAGTLLDIHPFAMDQSSRHPPGPQESPSVTMECSLKLPFVTPHAFGDATTRCAIPRIGTPKSAAGARCTNSRGAQPASVVRRRSFAVVRY